ncbi:hypothetical protein FRC12_016768 [Ceratobasidium sp. 428]|nr:hypothetical protein FRC12_016768 [Ceratobasidium sp. 428]
MSLSDSQSSIQELRAKITSLESQCNSSSQRFEQVTKDLQAHENTIEKLQKSKETAARKQDTMRKRISRFSKRQDHQLEDTLQNQPEPTVFNIKNSTGTIHPEVRVMLRKLAGENVATERMGAIVDAIATALGITVVGTFSARSVSRIILEGLVEAQLQITSEIDHAEGK